MCVLVHLNEEVTPVQTVWKVSLELKVFLKIYIFVVLDLLMGFVDRKKNIR